MPVCYRNIAGGFFMPRGNQLARQWRIIQILLASGIGRSVAELARELEANPRTVYRDLEALQTAGFPMYTERVDGKNLWAFLDAVKHHIPIPFGLSELMALYFCSDMIKALQDTVFYESLDSLFKKIKTMLPPESLAYLKSVQQTFAVGRKQFKQYSTFKEIINRVTEAAIKRITVQLVYYAMSRKKETTRMVDPYRIWFFNGTFYLVGHCHLRNEIRIFALERIKMLNHTDKSFTVPEGFDVEDMMRASSGVIKGRPEQVRICFDSEVAGYIQERVWHPSQRLLPQGDGSLVFEADIAVNEELRKWILSWGPYMQALETQSLVEAMRGDILRMADRYSGTHPQPQQVS